MRLLLEKRTKDLVYRLTLLLNSFPIKTLDMSWSREGNEPFILHRSVKLQKVELEHCNFVFSFDIIKELY